MKTHESFTHNYLVPNMLGQYNKCKDVTCVWIVILMLDACEGIHFKIHKVKICKDNDVVELFDICVTCLFSYN